jgi:hypothetical protein
VLLQTYKIWRGDFVIVTQRVEEDGDGQYQMTGTERPTSTQVCGETLHCAHRLQPSIQNRLFKAACSNK